MSYRKVLIEFIALYKQFPCLWDTKKIDYSNKEARDQAYEVLLEKFKEIQADAIVYDVKKKIDHLRAGYRREHKKVLLSRINGDDDVEYRPQLWYYSNMDFLADVLNISRIESNDEESSNYRTPKQLKLSPVYLRDREDGDDTYEADIDDGVVDRTDDGIDQMMQHTQDITEPIITTHLTAASEAEAFGTTVGFQLKEVHPTQRAIAEKLISDVIFHARFNNLTINTKITLNDKIDNQFM